MRTRQSSPSSERTPKRWKKLGSEQKVCIVLRTAGVSAYYHCMYIVDLNDKGNPVCTSSQQLPRRKCSVNFAGNYPFDTAFIVFKSTLYMFGGVVKGWGTKSYSYDLSSVMGDDEPDYVLNFDSMVDNKNTPIKPIPGMASPKVVPRAVLIGARICVFSTYFDPSYKNVEMYDPANRTWLSVPEPPILHYTREQECCEVYFYYVENLSLFISTREGSYSIDFGLPSGELKWVPCHLPTRCRPNPPSLLKVGDFLYWPDYVCHVNHLEPCRYPILPSLCPGDRAIMRLPKQEDKSLRVCTMETGGFNESRFEMVHDPVLRVSILKFDTDQLRPTIVKSIAFLLDEDILTYSIDVVGAFLMYPSDDWEDQS